MDATITLSLPTIFVIFSHIFIFTEIVLTTPSQFRKFSNCKLQKFSKPFTIREGFTVFFKQLEPIISNLSYFIRKRSWFNGRMHASHACDPGPIPGGRISFCFFLSFQLWVKCYGMVLMATDGAPWLTVPHWHNRTSTAVSTAHWSRTLLIPEATQMGIPR